MVQLAILVSALFAAAPQSAVHLIPYTTQTGCHFFSPVKGHYGGAGSADYSVNTDRWWTDDSCKSIELTPRFSLFVTARKIPSEADAGPKTLYAKVQISTLISGQAGAQASLTPDPKGMKIFLSGRQSRIDINAIAQKLPSMGRSEVAGSQFVPLTTVTLPIRMWVGITRLAATGEKYLSVQGSVDIELGKLSLSNGAKAQIRYTVVSVTDVAPPNPKEAP